MAIWQTITLKKFEKNLNKHPKTLILYTYVHSLYSMVQTPITTTADAAVLEEYRKLKKPVKQALHLGMETIINRHLGLEKSPKEWADQFEKLHKIISEKNDIIDGIEKVGKHEKDL